MIPLCVSSSSVGRLGRLGRLDRLADPNEKGDVIQDAIIIIMLGWW